MALFPYGFDAKPEGPRDPCPTRLPDPPTANLEVRYGPKTIFAPSIFLFPGKWAYFPMVLMQSRPAHLNPCTTCPLHPPTAKLEVRYRRDELQAAARVQGLGGGWAGVAP